MKAARPYLTLAAAVALAGCTRKPPQADAERIALLKRTYDHLHQRLEKAAGTEPLVASAFADGGQVIVAIRSGLIQELAGNVAARYLDQVTVDVSEVQAHSSGELRRKTFLGRIKLGEWSVGINLGKLQGRLRAGSPRISLRSPDLIDVELPVDVRAAEGDATLQFGWDSAGLANAVCRDFELKREIRGRVLPQRHRVSGALRLENTGTALTATPIYPDREIRLELDLSPRSWVVVEEALRSQDTFGTCGVMMDPEKGLARLKELAARGITVRLPSSIFRTVSLPARFQQSVKVAKRAVALQVKTRSLRVEPATLWSSASVQVQTANKP